MYTSTNMHFPFRKQKTTEARVLRCFVSHRLKKIQKGEKLDNAPKDAQELVFGLADGDG